MKFFRNAINALKPSEYSVQVSAEATTVAAVRRVRKTQLSYPVKKVVGTLLALVIIGGGAVAGFSTNAATSQSAHAGWFEDQLCTNGEKGQQSGKWSDGKNRFAQLGGHTTFTMALVTQGMTKNDALSSSAILGSVNTKTDKALTAYEKYGMGYPIFDAWEPAWTDDDYTFRGGQSGKTASLSGGTDSSYTIPSGSSALLTNDAFGCLNFPGVMEAASANIVSYPMKLLMFGSISLYGSTYGQSISQEGSILHPIGASIDNIIAGPGGLRDTLFVPFIIPLIMIGAIFLAYEALIKRKTLASLQSIVWMILAIAAGTFFLQQPTKISSYADNTVATVQTVINSAITDMASTSDMCKVGTVSKLTNASRSVKCSIWYASLYQPWVVGQFGVGTNALSSTGTRGYEILTADPRGILNNKDYSISYGKTTVEADNWPQFMLDRQTNGLALQQSEVAYAQLSGDPGSKSNPGLGPVTQADGKNIGTPNLIWKGGTGNQLISAMLMWVSVPASSIVLMVFGISLLMYQLIMVAAIFMSPFFFLMGIIPNYGRAILMRYAELIVMLIIKRLVTSLVLVMYFLFYLILINQMDIAVILMRQLLIVILAILAISMRGKFVNMFASQVNFGGNKSIGLPGGKILGQTMGLIGAGAGFAVGGVTGAAIGQKIGSRVAGNHNDDLSGSGDMRFEGAGSSPTADTSSRRPQGSMADDLLSIPRQQDDLKRMAGDVKNFQAKRAEERTKRKEARTERKNSKQTPDTSDNGESPAPESQTPSGPNSTRPQGNASSGPTKPEGNPAKPGSSTPNNSAERPTGGGTLRPNLPVTPPSSPGLETVAGEGAASGGAAAAAPVLPIVGMGLVAAKKVGDKIGDEAADKMGEGDGDGNDNPDSSPGGGARPPFPGRGE